MRTTGKRKGERGRGDHVKKPHEGKIDREEWRKAFEEARKQEEEEGRELEEGDFDFSPSDTVMSSDVWAITYQPD